MLIIYGRRDLMNIDRALVGVRVAVFIGLRLCVYGRGSLMDIDRTLGACVVVFAGARLVIDSQVNYVAGETRKR
jgi:hypothetical protein